MARHQLNSEFAGSLNDDSLRQRQSMPRRSVSSDVRQVTSGCGQNGAHFQGSKLLINISTSFVSKSDLPSLYERRLRFCVLTVSMWKNMLLFEEDDNDMEIVYLAGCLQPERPVYHGRFSVDDFCETEFLSNFRFAKHNIIKLRIALRIPPVVVLPNSSVVVGMQYIILLGIHVTRESSCSIQYIND